MKNDLLKTKKRLSFKDYGEESRHINKKVKTQLQQKANNQIDKALKRKDLRNIYDIDDLN
jgi:hypothetical protein